MGNWGYFTLLIGVLLVTPVIAIGFLCPPGGPWTQMTTTVPYLLKVYTRKEKHHESHIFRSFFVCLFVQQRLELNFVDAPVYHHQMVISGSVILVMHLKNTQRPFSCEGFSYFTHSGFGNRACNSTLGVINQVITGFWMFLGPPCRKWRLYNLEYN